MGNSESYKQVPVAKIADESGDQVQDDLTFVFHTTDEDTPDRVVHDIDTCSPTWPYVVTSSGRLVAERRSYEALLDSNTLLEHISPGDAVEFVKPGKRFHWALYLGDDIFVHLKNNCIDEISSEVIFSDFEFGARIVSSTYKLKSLSVVQIVNNGKTQVGKALIWSCSEAFVMWCRTGRSEFTKQEKQIQNLDSSTPKTTKGKYMLEFHTPEETVMRRFSTLSELIDYRRSVEKFGKEFLLANKSIL